MIAAMPGPQPAADRGPAAVVAVALVALAGLGVLGPTPGLVVAAALTLVVGLKGLEQASRVAAVSAVATAFGAVAATVLEVAISSSWNLRFASDRPVANQLGALTGVLLLAAAIFGLTARRATRAPTYVVAHPRARRVGVRRSSTGLPLALVASGVTAVGRLVLGPSRVDPAVLHSVANLRLGLPLRDQLVSGAAPAPLLPALAVVTGLGPTGQGLVAAAVAGAALLLVVNRSASSSWLVAPSVVAAGTVAILGPAPSVLAIALVAVAAATLVSPPGGVPSGGVGLLLALATLADPAAAVGGLVVGALAVRRNGWARSGPFLACYGAGLAFSGLVARSVGAGPTAWLLTATGAAGVRALVAAATVGLLLSALVGPAPDGEGVRASRPQPRHRRPDPLG